VHAYPFPPRGLSAIVAYLRFLRCAGVPTTLVVPECHADVPDCANGHVQAGGLIRLEARFLLHALRELSRRRRHEDVCVYILGSMYLASILLAYARLRRVPAAYDLRSGPIGHRPFVNPILGLCERLSLLAAQTRVVISREAIGWALGRRYVRGAVEIPSGAAIRCEARGTSPSDPERVRCVCISSVDRYRGWQGVLDAFRGLEGFTLDLYGWGEAFAEMTDAARGLDNVRVLGYRPFEELQALLPGYDCGVSYIPREPYFERQPPLKTIEYLSAGVPVVGTATAGNRLYVNDANGILCDETSGAALRAALLRFRESRFDRARVQASILRFTWDSLLRHAVPRVARRMRRAS